MSCRWRGGGGRAEPGGWTLALRGQRWGDLPFHFLWPRAGHAGLGGYAAGRRDLAAGELPQVHRAGQGHYRHYELVMQVARTAMNSLERSQCLSQARMEFPMLLP